MIQSEAEPSCNRTHSRPSQYVEAVVPEIEIPGSSNEDGKTKWNIRQGKQNSWCDSYLIYRRRVGCGLSVILSERLAFYLFGLQRPISQAIVCCVKRRDTESGAQI